MVTEPARHHALGRLGRGTLSPGPARPAHKPVQPRNAPPPEEFGLAHSVPSQRPAPDHDFWQSLTSEERFAFLTAASGAEYAADTTLWREGDIADHVVVILSGHVRLVRHGRDGPDGTRGPGDIVGGRTALLLQKRRATVVALTDVRTLVMTAVEFMSYLGAHGRVLAMLDDASPPVAPPPARAPEPVPARPAAASVPADPAPAATPAWAGRMCSILFADVAGFSARERDDDDRLEIRRVMYGLLHDAFANSGVPWATCHREDRGDGALIVVPPETPTGSVVDPMLALLAAGLRRHNHRSSDAMRIQLRLALHVGPVVPDSTGVSGSAVIHAARLLDAQVLRDGLAETGSDLGFIASTFVYDHVIVNSPGFVTPDSYRQVAGTVKGTDLTGWMHLSGTAAPPL